MGERLTFTFALTGRREWGYGTQGVALGYELVGLSARAGPPATLAANALKGQPVPSPGQRPGYQSIKSFAL